MFSRKKPEPPKRRSHNLSQFGLTDIPDDFDPSVGLGSDHDDGNDSDLEAELAAIAGGGSAKPKPKPKAKLVPTNELDKMIADSLKDVGSDDDDEADAENDSELLGELQGIVGGSVEEQSEEVGTDGEAIQPMETSSQPDIFLPTTDLSTADVIKQRIEMYKQAEANAKAAGDSSKMRRFNRGLKTLNDLLKQANSGKVINLDDIPPEVSVKPVSATNIPAGDDTVAAAENLAPSVPVRQAPLPPAPKQVDTNSHASEESPPTNPLVQQMRVRQQEYKSAALQSKRAGDTAMALQFLKIVKQFDVVLKMCEEGQEVDLSDMPPPPDQFKEFMEKMQANAEPQLDPTPPPPAPVAVVNETADVEMEPSTTTNILEALQQRLDKYKSVEAAAKTEGNASKARRFGRIVKQYEDAIKAYKAGRPVVYDELPVPPGFGPLPADSTALSPTSPKVDSVPSTPPTASTSVSSSGPSPTPSKQPSPPQHLELTTRTSGNHQKNNLAEQQMKILLDRQKEFKLAAIEAKKAGELDQAKEYLKIFKGFDALLNAASSGLPVDLNTLPVPPSQRENLEASFAIISTDECDPDDDISDIGVRIEEQLAKQLMMCKNTRDHHKAMGDIAGMNRFENLALTVQKDLDLVRYSKRKNFPLPKFHYEKRSFNIVHCNTDLTDNEIEIVVNRGINYNVPNPKEVDTYVKIEFPLLNDEIFKTKTSLIKDSDSPDYDQHFKVDIVRGNRQFQRIFKRHAVKFEVYSRGGFLRSDILIGTVNVKLQPLETKCDIHDTFDLTEGRKKVGGKLEIKLRVRNPILTKQMEHVNEKWLVLDT